MLRTLGQTTLTDAAKLLGVAETAKGQGGYKDWVTPLREWALQSNANLTRAMVAIAYSESSHCWNSEAKELLHTRIDQYGYEPEQP